MKVITKNSILDTAGRKPKNALPPLFKRSELSKMNQDDFRGKHKLNVMRLSRKGMTPALNAYEKYVKQQKSATKKLGTVAFAQMSTGPMKALIKDLKKYGLSGPIARAVKMKHANVRELASIVKKGEGTINDLSNLMEHVDNMAFLLKRADSHMIKQTKEYDTQGDGKNHTKEGKAVYTLRQHMFKTRKTLSALKGKIGREVEDNVREVHWNLDELTEMTG